MDWNILNWPDGMLSRSELMELESVLLSTRKPELDSCELWVRLDKVQYCLFTEGHTLVFKASYQDFVAAHKLIADVAREDGKSVNAVTAELYKQWVRDENSPNEALAATAAWCGRTFALSCLAARTGRKKFERLSRVSVFCAEPNPRVIKTMTLETDCDWPPPWRFIRE